MFDSTGPGPKTVHRAVARHDDPYSTPKVGRARLALPAPRCLPSGDVHLWPGWLDQPAWNIHRLTQILSADEQARAGRFRSEAHRMRFVVARGVLRSILGHYLGIEPNHVELCYGRHGKPYLAKGRNPAEIRFNVAHSHQLALYVFTRAREVGIDLEYTRPLVEIQQTAAGFMSERELALLCKLPADQQQDAFYLCWTCKEAYVKATGIGLQQDLKDIEVSMIPGKPARLLDVEGNPGETDRWSLQSFSPAPGYVAALAVEGHECLAAWVVPTLF